MQHKAPEGRQKTKPLIAAAPSGALVTFRADKPAAHAPGYVLPCHPALLKTLPNVRFRCRNPQFIDLKLDARLAALLAFDVFHRQLQTIASGCQLHR
ncbi:hypothetical protein SH528x_006226 [Novipirellula sp. SH528]|uniref:hypothetical protein n=1 Tax=Novipirellula sp. SH528 TaxID=3454466 RepID=UPI003FA0776E